MGFGGALPSPLASTLGLSRPKRLPSSGPGPSQPAEQGLAYQPHSGKGLKQTAVKHHVKIFPSATHTAH